MYLTDVLRKQDSIVPSQEQLFIATNDFDFNGLPILKDAMVYYDGKNEIEVNRFIGGILQKSNVPKLIMQQLPEDENGNYLVDKSSSNCQYEVHKIPSVSFIIWHNDHFDYTAERHPNSIISIMHYSEIQFSGISFSSMYYSFSTKLNALTVFISTKPFELMIKDKTLKLPPFVQIVRNRIDSYYLTPLEKIEYFGVSLEGLCRIDENGHLWGDSAEEFIADIIGHKEINQITISKYGEIIISHNGILEIELYNDKTFRVERYVIRKCVN